MRDSIAHYKVISAIGAGGRTEGEGGLILHQANEPLKKIL